MFFRKKSKAAPADTPIPPMAPIAAPAAPPVLQAPPPLAAMDGALDFRGLGRALWRKRTLILGLTLVAAASSYLVVNMITPRYRSEARLLLEVRENVFMRTDAEKNANDRSTNLDPEAVASQIQVVLSRDLAKAVIKKEGLADNPEFESGDGLRSLLGLFGMARAPNEMSQEERVMEAFYDRLNVFGVEKSRVIAVGFSSANPELASRVANSVAETYLNLQQSAKQNQTRAAGDWLAVEIEKMRKRVADAEAKVEEYRVQANLFVGSNNTSLPNQQLTELNSQISAARGQKADLEARASQLREQVRAGRPVEFSDIANSESMRRLVEQRAVLRAQLAEQSTTLLDQHPRIKELRAQIGELDRQIRAEGERLARQLENDAKVAGARVELLMASLNQAKQVASQSNEQDVQLRALEREAKTQRDLLESYLVKYREASARDSIGAAPPEARIISRATPAIKPSFPKKLPTVLIAAFAAFALSAGFTVTGALLATPMPSPYAYGYGPSGAMSQPYMPQPYAPVPQPPMMAMPPAPQPVPQHVPQPMPQPMPQHMPQPMAQHMPQAAAPQLQQPYPQAVPPQGMQPQMPAQMRPFAPPPGLSPHQPIEPQTMPHVAAPPLSPAGFANAAPQFAGAVPMPVATIEQVAQNLKQSGEMGRRVTVVGAARNAGTTYAAIMLARTLAQAAPVVLVDFAFGAPNLSVISTDPNAPGVAELVRGTASFGDIITRDQYSNVHLVATGNVGNDAALFSASPMLPTVIAALAQSYAHVVVDIGSAADVPVEYFVQLAQRAVLVSAEPSHPSTGAARERLARAGFADVMLVAGAVQAAAA